MEQHRGKTWTKLAGVVTAAIAGGWMNAPAWAQGPGPAAPTLAATRCEHCKVVVDGVLDDEIWSIAPKGEGFVQQQPKPLAPASQRTTVQVAFDETAVYVAVYAHDDPTLGIYAPLGRRDTEPISDWVRVAFDSYCDRRTAYEFSVNPAGTKVDALVTGGSNRDLTWDAVWDVGLRNVADGWIAEFRIPLSELRFNGSGSDWGFQVTRVIARDSEISVWAPVLQSDNQVVARYGALKGLNTLSTPMTVQLIPYGRLDMSRPVADGAHWSQGDLGLGLRGGGDVKAHVTSNLTLDATFLPDFGQVEADPSVVNLTAYETYLKERRPFFIEGVDILKFGVGIGNGDLGQDTLFYSRRIGGLAHLSGLNTGSNDTVISEPNGTDIYGAAKLSGKTAGGTSLAFLEAYTNEARATVDWEDQAAGPSKSQLLAPRTNYFIARGQQDFRDGHTTVGAIATNVTRDTSLYDRQDPTASGAIPLVEHATTAGIDLAHRTQDDEWSVQASVAGSDVRGSADAITQVQESSAHLYQRTDQHHATLDTTRTSLDGYAATLVMGKLGGEPWQFGLFNLVRSPGFESNDLGYLARADYAISVFWAGYNDYKAGEWFRRIQLNTNWIYGTTFGGETVGKGANIDLYGQFLNFWAVETGFNRDQEQLDVSALRGGPAMILPPHNNGWAYFRTDERLPVMFELNADVGWDPWDFRWDVNPSLTVRAHSRLLLTFTASYSSIERDRQYVNTMTSTTSGNDEFIIGHLRQQVYGLTARADLAITPTLTLQVYAAPYVSGEVYDNYRKVTNPRAARYDDRFTSFDYVTANGGSADYNFKQFRSTTVLRWEYLPGSALFVVWSQERTNDLGPGQARLGHDLRRLFFDTRGNDIVLLKLSYFLSV